MEWMSERLGSCLQLLEPRAHDRRAVVRPRARLGVELRRARAELRERKTLDGAVVQRDMRRFASVVRRDRKAVVLRSHEDAAAEPFEHRMVRAAVTERQLEGLVPGRE